MNTAKKKIQAKQIDKHQKVTLSCARDDSIMVLCMYAISNSMYINKQFHEYVQLSKNTNGSIL